MQGNNPPHGLDTCRIYDPCSLFFSLSTPSQSSAYTCRKQSEEDQAVDALDPSEETLRTRSPSTRYPYSFLKLCIYNTNLARLVNLMNSMLKLFLHAQTLYTSTIYHTY